MKKRLIPLFCVLLALTLCACREPIIMTPEQTTAALTTEPTPVETTAPTTPETSEAPTEATTVEATEPETTVPTEPAHSALYREGYSVTQVIEYFEEVALDMEYTDGTGNSALIQKWTEPIYYRISGDATEEDLAVLDSLFTRLNTIPGFPGIYPAAPGDLAHMTLDFLDYQDFRLAFSGMLQGEEADGAVQFWYYTATNQLHTAHIGYRTDVDQRVRNSVLIEEVVNALGLTDTVLRPDSVVYQYSNDNYSLSDIDFLILQLLYDPAIQCGMDSEACRNAIGQIYY